VEKLIPQNSITVVHGKGGVGKTWLMLYISKQIEKGLPVFDLNTIKTHVIYIDYENPLPMLKDRFEKLDINDVIFLKSDSKFILPKLDSQNWEAFKSLPSNLLIIIDTLRASQDGDENSSQDMSLVMNRLKELRDSKGFTTIILHHTPKSTDKQYKGSTG
jgi:RecA-family ATPase